MIYLKKASKGVSGISEDITEQVKAMLADIASGREEAVRNLAEKFDGWDGDLIVDAKELDRLADTVDPQIKRDIEFAHSQVTAFARAQLASMSEFEIELQPGVKLGQRLVPCSCAGCYVPGGQFAHAASAIMSVATAKVAGVKKIVACTPPRGDSIDPVVAYALRMSGADVVMALGGVQAIATMAYGLFTGTEADIVAGPGNAYVAEAKRLLFGRIGIDVLAGPTESLIVADRSANPMFVAVDLVSQAEHGNESPVWFVTNHEPLANQVLKLVPTVIQDLPKPSIAAAAWGNYGEVVLCASREEMLEVTDQYACEHTHVMADDLDWWRSKLRNYGSLFLGEECTVAFGDKTTGTNHTLPTQRAARYTGGLNVMKFIKVLTWQQLDRSASQEIAAVTSRISRAEGMEAHARAADLRLTSYYPGQEYDFEVYRHSQKTMRTDEELKPDESAGNE